MIDVDTEFVRSLVISLAPDYGSDRFGEMWERAYIIAQTEDKVYSYARLKSMVNELLKTVKNTCHKSRDNSWHRTFIYDYASVMNQGAKLMKEDALWGAEKLDELLIDLLAEYNATRTTDGLDEWEHKAIMEAVAKGGMPDGKISCYKE